MRQQPMLRNVFDPTPDAISLGSLQMSPTQTVSREVFEVFPTVAPSTPEPATARRAGEHDFLLAWKAVERLLRL